MASAHKAIPDPTWLNTGVETAPAPKAMSVVG